MARSPIRVTFAVQNLDLEKGFVRKARAAIKEVFAAEGERITESIREDLDYPFQSVPSYLHQFPKRKKGWRRGDPSKFATKSPTLVRSIWGRRVQQFPLGQHVLHDRLTYAVVATRDAVRLEIGYPKTLPARTTAILGMVQYGTRKMQPRPYLRLALKREATTVRREVNRALREVTNA
jgi:hypothetical protein